MSDYEFFPNPYNYDQNNLTVQDIENLLKGLTVNGNQLEENSVDYDHLVPDSIGEIHIRELSVNNSAIQNLSVTTAKIDDLAVTSVKIANGEIKDFHFDRATGNKIQIIDGDIVNVNASKLNAGIVDTAKVTIQGDNGNMRIVGNRLQVFDDQATPVERVSIGDVNADGTVYGLRVRGADGVTVLYDESGVYNEGITDGAVTNPKIGDNAVDGRVVAARSVTADHMVTNTITAQSGIIKDLKAEVIIGGDFTGKTFTGGRFEGSTFETTDANNGTVTIDNGQVVAVNGNEEITIREGRVSVDNTTSGRSASLFYNLISLSDPNANNGLNGGITSILDEVSLNFGDAILGYMSVGMSSDYYDLEIENSQRHLIIDTYGQVKIVTGPDGVGEQLFIDRPYDTNADTLVIDRQPGKASIKAESSWLILESTGSPISLNHYSIDDIRLVNGGGNVAIGSITATQKLEVDGNAKLNGHLINDVGGERRVQTDRLRLNQNASSASGVTGDLAYLSNGYNGEGLYVRKSTGWAYVA